MGSQARCRKIVKINHGACILNKEADVLLRHEILHGTDDPEESEEKPTVFPNKPKHASEGSCKCEVLTGRSGLVPRPPLQKPPSRGLEGSGGEGGGDEGLKVEGGFTFGRLQGGLKGASRGLKMKGASKEGLDKEKNSRGLHS